MIILKLLIPVLIINSFLKTVHVLTSSGFCSICLTYSIVFFLEFTKQINQRVLVEITGSASSRDPGEGKSPQTVQKNITCQDRTICSPNGNNQAIKVFKKKR